MSISGHFSQISLQNLHQLYQACAEMFGGAHWAPDGSLKDSMVPKSLFVILAVWSGLCFIRPDTSVSRGLSPSGDTWPIPSGLSCTFNQGAASVWPLQG